MAYMYTGCEFSQVNMRASSFCAHEFRSAATYDLPVRPKSLSTNHFRRVASL